MFIQNKGIVTMTVELLDTEEAQADDPLDVQVNTVFYTHTDELLSVWFYSDSLAVIARLIILASVFSACQATWNSLLEQSLVCVLKQRVTSSSLYFSPGKKKKKFQVFGI